MIEADLATKLYQVAEKLVFPLRPSQASKIESIPMCHPGCSKWLSSKAAANEEARRTLRYVEPVSDARTVLADFFSILLGDRGRREAKS